MDSIFSCLVIQFQSTPNKTADKLKSVSTRYIATAQLYQSIASAYTQGSKESRDTANTTTNQTQGVNITDQ